MKKKKSGKWKPLKVSLLVRLNCARNKSAVEFSHRVSLVLCSPDKCTVVLILIKFNSIEDSDQAVAGRQSS